MLRRLTSRAQRRQERATAEWIEETPLVLSNGGFAALPNLTTPHIDNAQVVTGVLGPFTGAQLCLGCDEAKNWAIDKTQWLVKNHKLDYLKHDIYVQKIVGRFHDLLVRTYGPNFSRWRDVFSDRVLPTPRSQRRNPKTARRS